MDLSIIMPAYNEEATILDAVQGALDAKLPIGEREVIVIENGSTDRTREVLRSQAWPPEVRIIEIDQNRGKGHAVREGVAVALGRYTAVLDADLEYDPNDYALMLPPLMDEGMDAVLGTRHWQSHSAYSYWYVVGNQFINTMANVIYNVYLSDCMVGMKVVRTDLFQSLELREDGFGFDAEVVARLLRGRARIMEVPVRYRARRREEGKKLTTRDGFRMVRVFLRCRVR
jgi:glycosyltransferase involved in cell wall biosynthesis